MTLCSFAENYNMFDITPVENLFIQEFMLKAPGDFVKVYIYGLKRCYHKGGTEDTMESFGRALGLETKIVENAFRYWERQGILKLLENEDSSFKVEYFNIKDVLYNNNYNAEKTLYKYREFNQNLQMIFGNRLLTPQEYLKIYDWLETLNLPKEVVLMMISFYIGKKSSKISINYLDKIAESWARDGINTLQKAEDYITASDTCFKDTTAVLKYLGIHRSPSMAELDLYKKWKQWGFSLNAILQACRETTKIQTPNMGYVDKILSSFNSMDIKTTQEIKNHMASREIIQNNIKEVLFHLGHQDKSPTPEHHSLYKKWTDKWELSHPVILLAAKQCVRKKTTSLEALNALLDNWHSKGLKTEDDIKSYLLAKKTMDNEIKAILDRAGDNRRITQGDRKLFKQWTEEWNIPFELVLLAAEYSIMAENKMPFINKILSNWYANDIKTIKAAREDHERHIKALQLVEQGNQLKKQVDFNKFEQHSYSEKDLESLFEDIENS